MSLAYWVASSFYAFRGVVLGYLLGSGTYDSTFFTYINYGVVTLALQLLLLSMWNITAYQLWIAAVQPLIWGTTTFVALAIIVIVQANDGVFLRTSVINNGTNSVSTLHTGDWLLHQVPLVELIVLLLLLRPTALRVFHNFWGQLGVPGKVGYVLYFFLSAPGVLAFYMLNIDYSVNYPTDISKSITWGLTIGLSLVLQLLLFGFFYLSESESLRLSTPTLR